ncbi:MAG: YceI family protein [Bdellovibrionales bacterium]
MKHSSLIKNTSLYFFATVLAFGILSHPPLANAASKTLSKTKGQVHFLAIGKPAMIKIRGTNESLSSKIELSDKTASGSFTLNLKDLNTGIGLRDKHMKEKYLEVDKYPDAILTFKNFSLAAPNSEADQNITGTLKMHGVEKPVSVHANVKTAANGTQFEGKSEFTVKLSDFNISIPSYMGIKVADQVELTVEFSSELTGEI